MYVRTGCGKKISLVLEINKKISYKYWQHPACVHLPKNQLVYVHFQNTNMRTKKLTKLSWKPIFIPKTILFSHISIDYTIHEI